MTAQYGVASETDTALAFTARTSRLIEGFEVGYGSMGYGKNRKRKQFTQSKGRAWR